MIRMKPIPNFGQLSGSRRFITAIEQAEMDAAIVHMNFGSPFAVGFHPVHAIDARRVSRDSGRISAIFKARHFSQIGDSVVGSMAVDMIKFFRNTAVKMKPCQPMRGIQHPVKPNGDVAARIQVSRRLPRLGNSRALSPSENAGFGVVIKKIVETFHGRIGTGHIGPLLGRYVKCSGVIAVIPECVL